ncbi:MAG: sugar phosphate nucleotidyltransferase [Thermoplasmatota archaeon]
MQVVVLAAGQGTRLRPLTHDRPKSMLNLAGRPLAHHLFEQLVACGVKEVHLVVGHGHDKLRAYFGDGQRFGLKLHYHTQLRQLGPGHALMQARAALDPDQNVHLIPADAWYDQALLARVLAQKEPCLVTTPDARSARHGIPVVQRGRVMDLALRTAQEGEEPSGGLYVLPPGIFERLETSNLRLRDAIAADLAANGPWAFLRAAGNDYVDLIEHRDLMRLHDRLMHVVDDDRQGRVEASAQLIGPVRVGEGSTIRAGTVITGPASIGRNCLVGPNAVLQPGTSLRNHVVVEPFTLLRRCSVSSNVTVGSHSRIDGAFLDDGVRVGNGTHVQGHEGILIGADARLGNRVQVLDNSRIGVRASVADGRTVGDVPDQGVAV